METISDKSPNLESFSFDKSSQAENVNCSSERAGEDTHDVVESFETLHQSIPWLQKADVSSDSHKGQLKILQAAIDYIIDLEEQLTEHLSEDLYRVALQESRAALHRTLAQSRRPFADVNLDSAALVPSLIDHTDFLHAGSLQDEVSSSVGMDRLS